MKNFNKLAIILFTGLTIMFSSCSSDSDSNGGGGSGPATGGFIKANAGGSEFLAQGAMFTGTFNDNSLNIVGSSTTGKGMNIQLYGINTALASGTYNMNATNQSNAYTGSITLTDVNLSTFTSTVYNSLNCDNANGTLTITVNDATKIEGTFSCTAKEVKANEACDGASKSITNGSFRVLKGS